MRLLEEHSLRQWLGDIQRSGRRLWAPQPAGELLLYQPVANAQDLALDFGKPSYSLKRLLFPITEPVLRYGFGDGQVSVEDVQPDGDRPAAAGSSAAEELVVFGVPPCDATAIEVLDRVFLAGEGDPFYARRRQRLTVIGLSCRSAQPECFCTAVGLSPADEKGSDLLLTQLGDAAGSYLLEVCTPKGESLLGAVQPGAESAGTQPEAELLRLKSDAEQRVRSQLADKAALSDAAARLRADFESPVWEEIGRKCLGCGVCTYTCPTCHCFDLVDEGDLRGGVRCRNWDSCAFALFTLHASGHNPRPTQAARYRQRLLHKFCYFVETAGINMCVGCGRCTLHCPVGLDIHQVRQRWQ